MISDEKSLWRSECSRRFGSCKVPATFWPLVTWRCVVKSNRRFSFNITFNTTPPLQSAETANSGFIESGSLMIKSEKGISSSAKVIKMKARGTPIVCSYFVSHKTGGHISSITVKHINRIWVAESVSYFPGFPTTVVHREYFAQKDVKSLLLRISETAFQLRQHLTVPNHFQRHDSALPASAPPTGVRGGDEAPRKWFECDCQFERHGVKCDMNTSGVLLLYQYLFVV